MQRVWTVTSTLAQPDGFGVALDGRLVRLPGGAPLTVPSRALADAIAAEWDAPRERFGPDDLPLTRLAGSAVERIAPDPAPIRASLLGYASSDLLCYRATAPDGLVAEQHRRWQPWLDWAARTLGARLAVTGGITAIDQPDEAIAPLADELAAQSAWSLAGLGAMVPALGSLVLGLAILRGALSPGEAHAIASLDELWQERRWGTDAEAAARRGRIESEIASAAMFVNLARS